MLLGRCCLWLAALLLSLGANGGAASYVKELQGVTLKIVRDRSVRHACARCCSGAMSSCLKRDSQDHHQDFLLCTCQPPWH